MVLTGESQIANINEPGLGVALDSGYFSIIDLKYNNGIPRGATRIGSSTYVTIRKEFSHIQNKSLREYQMSVQPKNTKRAIASVLLSSEGSSKKKGSIIYRESYQLQKKFNKESAFKYYQKVKKNNSKLITGKSAQIRYYGLPAKKRLPASAIPAKVEKASPARMNLADQEFQNSLNKMFLNNKRHDKEVNQLIDELETFDAKYKKEY